VRGGEEDGIAGPANGRDELYTTPDDLLVVADVVGVGDRGRYLVAATFGNVHGTYAPGNLVLRPEILEAGHRQSFTRAIAGHLLDHWQGVLKVDGGIADKHSFDPERGAGPARRRWPSASGSLRATRIRRPQPRRLGAGQ
jgi:hypothetical protein